jgi:beta-lactam-binding protein with PASTA domain
MAIDHSVTATFNRKGAAPAVVCTVPRVVGLSLVRARAKLRHAHCSVGAIDRKPSTRAKRGKVLAQKVKFGRRLRAGARVSLVVGKGRRKP